MGLLPNRLAVLCRLWPTVMAAWRCQQMADYLKQCQKSVFAAERIAKDLPYCKISSLVKQQVDTKPSCVDRLKRTVVASMETSASLLMESTSCGIWSDIPNTKRNFVARTTPQDFVRTVRDATSSTIPMTLFWPHGSQRLLLPLLLRPTTLHLCRYLSRIACSPQRTDRATCSLSRCRKRETRAGSMAILIRHRRLTAALSVRLLAFSVPLIFQCCHPLRQ